MPVLQWPAGRAATLVSPVCAYCKRLENSYERTCEAFDEIPDEIFQGRNDHSAPYPGDGGKQFVRFDEDDPESFQEPEPDEEGDFELPDPDDDEAWEKWHKESVKRIERSGKRTASELLQFARPYNYAKKLQEHQSEYREKMRGLAEQLREGKINHGQWKYRSQVEIARYTSDGYRLGKAQAQGIAPSKVKMTKADNGGIANSVQGQYKYFSEFAKETKTKIDADEELTTYVDARAAKYGGSVRSAMNEAYVAGQGETKLRWVRHKDDSCPTCIEQAGRVKTGAEWAAGGILPSQQVQCNGNCGCELLPER